jgi:hypothetical protein
MTWYLVKHRDNFTFISIRGEVQLTAYCIKVDVNYRYTEYLKLQWENLYDVVF